MTCRASVLRLPGTRRLIQIAACFGSQWEVPEMGHRKISGNVNGLLLQTNDLIGNGVDPAAPPVGGHDGSIVVGNEPFGPFLRDLEGDTERFQLVDFLQSEGLEPGLCSVFKQTSQRGAELSDGKHTGHILHGCSRRRFLIDRQYFVMLLSVVEGERRHEAAGLPPHLCRRHGAKKQVSCLIADEIGQLIVVGQGVAAHACQDHRPVLR